MFVFTTMIKFATILFLQHMKDVKKEIRFGANGLFGQRGPFKMQELVQKLTDWP